MSINLRPHKFNKYYTVCNLYLSFLVRFDFIEPSPNAFCGVLVAVVEPVRADRSTGGHDERGRPEEDGGNPGPERPPVGGGHVNHIRPPVRVGAVKRGVQ